MTSRSQMAVNFLFSLIASLISVSSKRQILLTSARSRKLSRCLGVRLPWVSCQIRSMRAGVMSGTTYQGRASAHRCQSGFGCP